MMTRVSLSTPSRFSFSRTVYSHGWCSLLPFKVDKKEKTLHRLLSLSNGVLVSCAISHSQHKLTVVVDSESALSASERREIKSQLASCFRLDEDLSGFYAEARKRARFRWIPQKGVGRMLRSPTVFEDVVKMMCTTNCSWSLTTIMVSNMIREFGKPFTDGVAAFPTPESIAGSSEGFMRKYVRAGYRSPYLIEFAERVANGSLDVESWRSSRSATDELFKQVQEIKGMGEYAAGNLLRLLGRYDYLALDSWVRGQYATLFHKGRKVSDRTINRAYQQYGRWRGLFFWLEMTRHWFNQKFPEW